MTDKTFLYALVPLKVNQLLAYNKYTGWNSKKTSTCTLDWKIFSSALACKKQAIVCGNDGRESSHM